MFSLLSFVLLSISDVQASKPKSEKSPEKCSQQLAATQSPQRVELSTATLISVGQLLDAVKDPYLIRLHVLGQAHQREFPSPGLGHMFETARSAADALVAHLEDDAVRPEFHSQDLFTAAAHTEALMRDPKQQPKYIREAVLIRDGVVMVVPLLVRIRKGDKPLYQPVVVKGHQKLQDKDVLTAAFAAWALGRSFNEVPFKAEIFLKPMRDERSLDGSAVAKRTKYEAFEIEVSDHLHEVERIHADYMNLLRSEDALNSLRPRRSTVINKGTWGPHIREILHAQHDLSMMPYPPSIEEVATLDDLGLGTMVELAKLDVNSERFAEVCVIAGIKTHQLNYYVAHAKAVVAKRPLIRVAYEDPFASARHLVHIDFEDLMAREFRSGVYLFGSLIENPRSKKQHGIVHEEFIFADQLTPMGVEEAWVKFIAFFKKNPLLKDRNYLISTYSHHEVTKFNQELDMVKGVPDDFTPQQRSSPYYWESEDGESAKLIRNRAFFQRHPELKPEDVFTVLNRVIDLYPYILHNFAFPTYSNGLKHILEYMGGDLRYPGGWNGLESIEWANRAYQTKEPALFEKIRVYNRFDVLGNLLVARFLRENASRPADRSLIFDDENAARRKQVDKAANARQLVDSLLNRRDLLLKVLGKPLGDLTRAQREQLLQTLDRTEYLNKRLEIQDDLELSASEREGALQHLLHEHKGRMKSGLIEFFERVGRLGSRRLNDDIVDTVAEIFLDHRLDAFTDKSVSRMILLERLMSQSEKLLAPAQTSTYRRLDVPDAWEAKLDQLVKTEDLLEGLDLKVKDIRDLWRGLYYRKAFELK